MPSLASACSREAVTFYRECGHVVLRESMAPCKMLLAYTLGAGRLLFCLRGRRGFFRLTALLQKPAQLLARLRQCR